MKPLQSFDPFSILELPSDATINDIKRKFRKLSLLKHPDKNPDNPLAVKEFIKLTKAFKVSSDLF
jgi:curved DNA-binding protein CbpA